MQTGGCGSRSPRSRTEEISLAGMPSYGFDPKVVSSHTVTPGTGSGTSEMQLMLIRFKHQLQGVRRKMKVKVKLILGRLELILGRLELLVATPW